MNFNLSAELLLVNSTDMSEQITNWVIEHYPSRTQYFEKCTRDLGCIIEALAHQISKNQNAIETVSRQFFKKDGLQLKSTDVEFAAYEVLLTKINELLERNNLHQTEPGAFKAITESIEGLKYNIENGVVTGFKNYKYAFEYDLNQIIDPEFILNALKAAWSETPSKNNFMPYKVHVLGPEFAKEKEEMYWLCLGNETKANGNIITDRDQLKQYEERMYPGESKASYHNIINAPYVLIFTQRVETKPNKFQQQLVDKGFVYEQMATDGPKKENARKNAYLEIGIFSTNFAGICLNNGIDISHTLCFPGDKKDWPQEHFSFLDSHPMLIMTIGKGAIYRTAEQQAVDPKPDFDRIVNILSKDTK